MWVEMSEGPFWNGDARAFNDYCVQNGDPQLFAWEGRLSGCQGLLRCSGLQTNMLDFQEARGPGGAQNHWFTTKDGTVQGCLGPCKDAPPPGLLDNFYAFASSKGALLGRMGPARAERALQEFNANARALVEQERIVQGCVQGYEASCLQAGARPWGQDFYSSKVQVGGAEDTAGETLGVARRVAQALCSSKCLQRVAENTPPTQDTCRSCTAWTEAVGWNTKGDEVCLRVGVMKQKRTPQGAIILVVEQDKMWNCIANYPLPHAAAAVWTARQFDGPLCAQSIAGCLAQGCDFEAYGQCEGGARAATENVVQCMGGPRQNVREVATGGGSICTGTLELRAGKGGDPIDDLIVQSVEARAGPRNRVSVHMTSGTRNALWESFCRAAARHAEARHWLAQKAR